MVYNISAEYDGLNFQYQVLFEFILNLIEFSYIEFPIPGPLRALGRLLQVNSTTHIKVHVILSSMRRDWKLLTKGPTRFWTWWTWCQRSRRGRSTWPTQSPSTPPPSSSTTSQPTLEDFRWEKIAETSFRHFCIDAKTLSFNMLNLFRCLTLAQWRKLKLSPSPIS